MEQNKNLYLDNAFQENKRHYLKDFEGIDMRFWGASAKKLSLEDQYILANHLKFSPNLMKRIRGKLK